MGRDGPWRPPEVEQSGGAPPIVPDYQLVRCIGKGA